MNNELENPFKDGGTLETPSCSKSEKEINSLNLITEKYKNLVIKGLSIPSEVLTTSSDEPVIRTEFKNLEDITEDEKQWLETNINFITYPNGDFISINSGNQFAFYQTLLAIQLYIMAHGIPPTYFNASNPNSRYYKIWNIGYLIDDTINKEFKPKFKIKIEVGLNAKVNNKTHLINKFRHETEYSNFDIKDIKYNKKIKTGKVFGTLVFADLKDFEEHLSYLRDTKGAINKISEMFNEGNFVYVNNLVKTSDTFKVFVNPKAIIKRKQLKDASKNILIYPIIENDFNLMTWYNNAKTIEVEMESTTNAIKELLNKYTYDH